jgi:hypothetical protein
MKSDLKASIESLVRATWQNRLRQQCYEKQVMVMGNHIQENEGKGRKLRR